MESMFKLIEGPIEEKSIFELISNKYFDTTGAHSIFIGRVRADTINGKTVTSIHYSSYKEMAEIEVKKIFTEIKSKFNPQILIILHSIGIVKVGEICVVVFVSAKNRKAAIHACENGIELLKKNIPLWGVELNGEQKLQWKYNRP